jgi:glutaredoxin 3
MPVCRSKLDRLIAVGKPSARPWANGPDARGLFQKGSAARLSLGLHNPSSVVNLTQIAMNKVRMYTTQVCPYCVRAKALLKQRGVDAIEEIRVDMDPQQRMAMMELTGRRTVPQIFIGNTHVGGCDDLVALDQRGGLMPLLQAAH